MAKILAVDDEPEILVLLRSIIESDGNTFVSTTNGLQAIDFFRSEKPDLVLLDVMIPDRGGLAICHDIRSESSVPILMVSGASSEEKIIRCYESGADDYIMKPFVPDELRAKIKVHLERARASRSAVPSAKLPGGAPPTERRLFGPYVLLGILGRGASGTVYRAHPMGRPDQPLAIKALAMTLGRDEKYLQRFLREVESAKALDDPHVVRIYDAGHFHGNYYFAMELVDGISLFEQVETHGKMSVNKVLDLAGNILNALAAVHEAGYVHHDVSAKNILLNNDGPAKLADFGIAQRRQRRDTTTTTFLEGTPQFMAPEVIEGKEPDIRSDLYALGIAVYYAVVGEAPFTGDTMQVMYQQVHRPLVVPKEVPDDVAGYIYALAAKAPEERPPTPGAALIETAELLQGHPV